MDKKIRKRSEHASTQKTYRSQPSVGVSLVENTETLDSFKEELSKLVLKWLSGKLGIDKKEGITQTVYFTQNGPTGPIPPNNPQNINIINVVVTCPHVSDCPHFKANNPD